MRKAIAIFIILSNSFVGNCALAQILINGTVLEKRTNAQLPYAHVYLKNKNTVGTITNHEGKFTISLPGDAAGDSMVASFIGFKSLVVPVEKIRKGNFTFELEESSNLLKEVVVTAKDTLRIFLKAAYDRIALNYPVKNFLIRGFYRETNLVASANKFIYFSEANIEFYNHSYTKTNSKYGPARIIEGGKFEVKDRYVFSNVHFYAGVYSPQRHDVVKERIEFIQPHHYTDYVYTVGGMVEYEDRPTIIIRFKPRKNALYEGTLFIDSQTLAYVKFDYKLSGNGLRKENSGTLSSFNYTNRSFQVQYRLKGGQWHLLYVIQDGKGVNKKYTNELRYTNEFVATQEVECDRNPIPDSEAVPFHAFYTSQNEKFNNEYWKKTEVISRPEKLDSTINLLFIKVSASNEILLEDSTKIERNKKLAFKSRLVKLSSSISNGIFFVSAPLKHQLGNYELSYSTLFSLEKEIATSPIVNSVGFDFKYYLNQNSCIILQGSGSVGNNTEMSFLSIGAQYSKRLTGWKKPLFAEVGLHIYQTTYETIMGTSYANSSFRSDGVNFKNSDRLTIGLGENRWGMLGSFELIYKLHTRFAFFTKASVSLFSRGDSYLFIHKRRNSFLRLKERTARVDLDSNDVSLVRNSASTNESPVTFNSIQLIFNSGLRFGLSK